MGFAALAFAFLVGLFLVAAFSSPPKAFLRVVRLLDFVAGPILLVWFAICFVFLIHTCVVLFGLSR
ncbi:hypothetical protein [Rubinisphaera sp.]|uniref:hypothetical protein n=1 Tax=Rubinisphaera sp. TaxID=2024857 RepID=UPI0025F1A690|nr:hypothetical protein [Rubinisphaera sp.]